jgi:hypothetical protein
MADPRAGYSSTPLSRKLGLREGCVLWPIAAPRDYRQWLEPLPAGVRFVARAGADVDIAHLFVAERDTLADRLGRLRAALRPDAAAWVSWPKKSARVPTTVTEDVVRELALPLGFVDIKVCAVTEVWSGLKLVVRAALR